MKIAIENHNELYVVNTNDVVYFQADDHYTHIFYDKDNHVMVPFSLSYIESAINDKLQDGTCMHRLGRKYIINIRKLHRVSISKQEVVLLSKNGLYITLHVSKSACQTLKSVYIQFVENNTFVEN